MGERYVLEMLDAVFLNGIWNPSWDRNPASRWVENFNKFHKKMGFGLFDIYAAVLKKVFYYLKKNGLFGIPGRDRH